MLLGEYEHTIDDKNRLTLPAKFRASASRTASSSRAGSTAASTPIPRRAGSDSSSSGSPGSTRSARRRGDCSGYFFAGASEAEPDKQGRVIAAAALLEHAALGREVVVAGVRDHLEIWDRAAWRAQLEEVEGSAEHVAERLAAQRD